MNININPFQHLYFSDDAQMEDNFVRLFSAEVLQHHGVPPYLSPGLGWFFKK